MFSVARAAWMLRYFGATNVRIMSGGMKKWDKEGRDTVSGPYTPGEGLPEEGDYSYAASTKIYGKAHEKSEIGEAITDIDQVHHVAYFIVNKASDW